MWILKEFCVHVFNIYINELLNIKLFNTTTTTNSRLLIWNVCSLLSLLSVLPLCFGQLIIGQPYIIYTGASTLHDTVMCFGIIKWMSSLGGRSLLFYSIQNWDKIKCWLPDTSWTSFKIHNIKATLQGPLSCPLLVEEWCFLSGQLIIWAWPSAVSMQDPIRQSAGWNPHHRPPPISVSCIYLFPFTSCFWILRIDFYMYMCALGIGLRRRRRRALGDTPLMGEWRAWKWRAGWLNACPSLPILLVTGGLSFSRPAHICLPLYDSLDSPICMFDRQQTGLCMSK